MRVLFILSLAAAAVATAVEQPAQDPVLGSPTIHGCYSSVGELKLNGSLTFNSFSSCYRQCEAVGAPVGATQGNLCYCGGQYPPAAALVNDSSCTTPCPGFAFDACGGAKAFTVINTGLKLDVGSSSGDSSNSQSSLVSVSSTSTAFTGSLSSTPAPTATTGSGSRNTSTSSTSSSLVPIGTNGAVSQLSYNGLSMAVLGMGTWFLI